MTQHSEFCNPPRKTLNSSGSRVLHYPRILGLWLGIIMYKGVVSGGDRHFMELIRYYPENRLTVVTTRDGERALRDFGIKGKCILVDFSLRSTLCNPDLFSNFSALVIYVILMLKALIQILKLHFDYEVVCASSHFLYDVLPSILAWFRKKGCRLIIYNHMLMPSPFSKEKHIPMVYSLLTWIQQKASLTLIKRYADIVFVLPSEVEKIIGHGISPNKVRIMINGVNFSQIEKVKRLSHSYEGCFIARLSPYKGLFDLVKIWSEVCQSFPSARIAIIGTERKKYVSLLRKMIHRYRLDKNFDVLGALEENRKYSVLKSSKVFVYPSHLESFGIVIVEALACGVPVVAYDLPAYKIFGSRAIEKAPLGDVHSFSQLVVELLKDRKKRMEMSKHAKMISKRFCWKQAIERDLHAFIAE